MKLSTPLSARFGLASPIVQAPMAGGPSSQELVAACSAAGALGSFGFAYTQPDEMKKQSAWVRAITDRPFGINLFTSGQPAQIDSAAQRGALDAVAGYYKEMGLPVPEPVNAPYAPDLDAQLAAVEEIAPRVFTVHLSDLPEKNLGKLKAKGILVGGSATCVAEAQHLESLGFDFVIAQGGEAGGHRGIAASLALGAQLAQLGTAFIPCPESGAAQIHKDLVLKSTEDTTRVTEKFSGKPARGLSNRFMTEMAAKDAPQLAFPAQNSVTGKLRQASAKAGQPDFIALWAGQAVSLSRALPAADLIARLETETIESIQKLKGILHEG